MPPWASGRTRTSSLTLYPLPFTHIPLPLNLCLSVAGRTGAGNLYGRHNGEPVQRSREMNVDQERARTRAPIVRLPLARRFQALPAAGQVVEISADSQIELPV